MDSKSRYAVYFVGCARKLLFVLERFDFFIRSDLIIFFPTIETIGWKVAKPICYPFTRNFSEPYISTK